jgi:hypothetical protein
MHTATLENLDALGAAALGPAELARVAASALRTPPVVELVSARATAIADPASNMTTGGLWRVEGAARTPRTGRRVPAAGTRFGAVVKLVQSPLLWSGIDQLPPDFRDGLARNYPWRTEARVYASGLDGAMPAGGRLPEVYRIDELDGQRTAIWMEDVAECPDAQWSDDRFHHAATLLGRLAGSSAVRELGPDITGTWDADRVRFYLDGPGTLVFFPAVQGQGLWDVPAVAAAADPALIEGMRCLAGRAYELADEITALPALPAHGDASPQNLLVESTADGPGGGTGFAVIDWGMYGGACAGFDLSQLLAGRVNQGTMGAEALYRLEPLCLHAYCEGLAEAGTTVDEDTVRRGHAASMALFAGLQAVPTQRLAEPDSEELRAFVAARVGMARFVLDLLASTD